MYTHLYMVGGRRQEFKCFQATSQLMFLVELLKHPLCPQRDSEGPLEESGSTHCKVPQAPSEWQLHKEIQGMGLL